MKTKIFYVFVVMLMMDLLASCSKPDSYNVTINKVFLTMKDYNKNKFLVEDDEVAATALEANLQYEYVQYANNWKIPSLLSTSAYAKKSENLWVFTNTFKSITVISKRESGPDVDITANCTFIYNGITYISNTELALAINSSIQSFGQGTLAAPTIGYKIRFPASLANSEKQLIRVRTELSNESFTVTTPYYDIN